MSKPKLHIFISHDWDDKLKAEKIYQSLKDFCVVWMDYRQLKPGDAIQDSIDSTLKDADIMLVLWTTAASQSQGVASEIDSAKRLGKRIIPCFLEYDVDGLPQPELPASIRTILGVDFFHFNTGVARLVSFLFEQSLESESGMVNDPKARLVQELDGMLDYLSNYRNARNLSVPREQWVQNIVQCFEEFVAQGGDVATLQPLLLAAYEHQDNDPEGIGLLIEKLEPMFSSAAVAPAGAEIKKAKKKRKKKSKIKHLSKTNPQAEDLLQQAITNAAPPALAGQWRQAMDYYIDSAPMSLNAMQVYCVGVGSPAGCEVVNFLNTYLNNADDLIPDQYGKFGLMDDAWLIHNTLYRLIESGALPANLVMLDWQRIIATDQFAISLMPAGVVQVLDQYVMTMLNVIAAEINSYQPQFGSGNMSGGNSYADQWYDAGVDAIQNIGPVY